MSEDIFIHADRALVMIFNQMSREFQNLSTQLGFDELNVLETRNTVNAMYQRMNEMIVRRYEEVAQNAFQDAVIAVPRGEVQKQEFDSSAFVALILRGYNPVSDFVYTREYTRKRDRLFESIIATERGNQEMRRNLKRALDVLANQVRQYVDNITIEARIEGFRRNGVEYVRWVAEDDRKTCSICRERNGRIFPIDDLPDIPAHWHCRCHLEPATIEGFERQEVV